MIRNDFACLNFFLFYLILVPAAHAQPQSAPDTDTTALKKAILVYTRSKAAEAGLYNGVLYAGYNLRSTGHPFFQSDSPIQGSLTYDGAFFPDIPLSYDLEKDLVVIPDKRNILKIQLISEKLPSFNIGDHRFIHLVPNNSDPNAPSEGFCEVLYEGKITALARYKKMLQTSDKVEENGRYHQYDSWYFQLNGRFYPVRHQRDLFSLPGTPGDALKDHLKKNHISFKKDPGYALTKAAEFYCQAIK